MTRLAAWRILRSGSTTPLRDVDRLSDAYEVDPRDRGLLRRIIGTEIRRRTTLRTILHRVAPAMTNPDMMAHLHVALAQILCFDKIPEHAIVSEASDAVRRTLGPSKVRIAREFLKSVFARLEQVHTGDPRRDIVGRNLSFREPVFDDPAQHPLVWAEQSHSMPAPLLKRWTARYGNERALALARWALEEPPLSIRVVRGTRDEVASELAPVETRPGVHERILLASLDDVSAVTSSAAFTEGRITIQGETALRAAELAGAKAGETWLDLCAAPGGKTAVLLESGAHVVACDVSDDKLARVSESAARLRCAERLECVVGENGTALGSRQFDGVLVDAPCSNTGVLAQRPEARWRFGKKTMDELVAIQTALFERAAELVRPGGRLVWSTCSLEPAENRRAVESFVARHTGWSELSRAEDLPDAATTHARGSGPIDGGFRALLARGA